MDIANLGITVNSGQLLLAAERMDKMGGAAKAVENRLYGFSNGAKEAEGAMSRVAARVDGTTKAFNGFKNVLQVAGISLAAKEAAHMADVWSDLKSRLTLATGGIQEGADVMVRLQKVARTTYSELTTTVDSFIANSRALKDLGYNTQQQLNYTEALNNALVVSSVKGEQAASVQTALSRAMALGKLSGNELHTVIASGGRVAELLADQLGVTVAQLTKLGANGKITGDIINSSLVGNLEKLREEAESMPATIGDAYAIATNSVFAFIGVMDQTFGASNKLAEGIIFLSDHIEALGTALIALGGFSAMKMFVPYITKAAQAAKSTLEFNKSILLGNSAVLDGRTAIAMRAKAAHDVALADKAAAAAALQAAQAERARAFAALEAAKAGQLAGITRAQATAQLVAANKAVNAASLTMASQNNTATQTLGVMNTAMKNATFSARAMSIAMGGLSFLGGPLGVAILGIGTAMYIQSEKAEKARKKSEELHGEWEKLGLLAPTAAENIDKVAASLAALSKGERSRQLKATQDDIKRITALNENRSFWSEKLQDDVLSGILDKAENKANNNSEDQKALKVLREQIALVQKYPELAVKAKQSMQELLATNISEDLAGVVKKTVDSFNIIQMGMNNISLLAPEEEVEKLQSRISDFKRYLDNLKVSNDVKASLSEMVDQLARGDIQASELIDKMESLNLFSLKQGGFPYLRTLVNLIEVATQRATELDAALNKLDGKTIEIGVNATGLGNLQYLLGEADRVTKSLEEAGAEAVKQASRTPMQVRLDEQKEKLRQQIKPDERGLIDDSVLTKQAQAVIDAYDKANKKTNKSAQRDANAYRDLVKSANDRIAQIQLETQLAGENGIAADTMRMKLEMLQHAQDKGRSITEAQRNEIDKLSKSYEQAATAAAKAKLSADLYTDRVKMGLTTVEQGIFDKMEQYGIPYGSDPQIAAAIRYNSVLEMGMGYTKGFFGTLISGAVNGAKGMENLGGALKNVGNQLLSLATNDIINSLFRSLLGGGGSGGGIFGSLFGGLFGGGGSLGARYGGRTGLFADGGVFGTSTQRFANGGAFTNSIVTSPTPFRFADGGGFSNGVMGEAGPEAILPLKRDAQGRLGVSQHGGGGNQGGATQSNVNVSVKPSKYFDTIVETTAQEQSQQAIKQFANSQGFKQAIEGVTRSVISKPSKRF